MSKRRLSEEHKAAISKAKTGKPRLCGTNHYLWRRGRKGCPHDFYGKAAWERLATLVRKRDNYTCQSCGKQQQSCERKLDVCHIINLNDDITQKGNMDNLITMCRSCHTITNNTMAAMENNMDVARD